MTAATAVDDEIRSRFGALIPRACDGELSDWETTSNGALALILLLDQFTRNIHRGTPDAYLGDPRAFEGRQPGHRQRPWTNRCIRWPAYGSTTRSIMPNRSKTTTEASR